MEKLLKKKFVLLLLLSKIFARLDLLLCES